MIFTTFFTQYVKESLTRTTIFTEETYHNFYQQKILFIHLKLHIMRNILYLIAIILVILWATGYFAFSVGYVIHILLVIAVIALLLGIIRGRRF